MAYEGVWFLVGYAAEHVVQYFCFYIYLYMTYSDEERVVLVYIRGFTDSMTLFYSYFITSARWYGCSLSLFFFKDCWTPTALLHTHVCFPSLYISSFTWCEVAQPLKRYLFQHLYLISIVLCSGFHCLQCFPFCSSRLLMDECVCVCTVFLKQCYKLYPTA